MFKDVDKIIKRLIGRFFLFLADFSEEHSDI